MIARLLSLLVLLSACAAAAERADVALVLKQQALVDRADVRLGDVAEIRTADQALRARLEKLHVVSLRRAGTYRTIRRNEVVALVAHAVGDVAIVGQGAERTTVRLRAARYSAEQLIDAAREHLMAHVREQRPALSRIHIVPVGDVPNLQVPIGDVAVTPRPIGAGGMSKRVCVWLDVQLNGKVYRSVPVWLALESYAPVLVSRRAIKPREKVSPGDFAVEERDVAHLGHATFAKAADIPGQRARTFIPAGAIVLTKDLEQKPPVLADGIVDVRVTAGTILIETHAIAEQDGYVGDYVRLRNPKTDAVFKARVVGENTVAITQR